MIKFDSKKHAYTDDKGRKYLSVTQLLAKEFPFNAPQIAKKVVKCQGSKYYGWDPRLVLREWRESAVQGNKAHHAVEVFIKENKLPKDKKLVPVVQKFDKLNFRGKLLSEVRLSDEDLLIAGTVDLLEDCGDYYWLWDIKTSAKIDEDKLLKFSMQLEIYKRLAEKQLNKKVILGGVVWLKQFVEKQEKTRIEVKKVIDCAQAVDEILAKRRNEILALHNNR